MRSRGWSWIALAPVEDELAFGEAPAPVDLGEVVEVAEGGDHDHAGVVFGEHMVGDRVALARRAGPKSEPEALAEKLDPSFAPARWNARSLEPTRPFSLCAWSK